MERTNGAHGVRAPRGRTILTGLFSLALLASVAPTPAHAAVWEVKGGAFGWRTSVSLFGGPTFTLGDPPASPAVNLPPGGSTIPLTGYAPSGKGQYGPAVLYSSGPVAVSTQGDNGNALRTGEVRSSATATNVGTWTGVMYEDTTCTSATTCRSGQSLGGEMDPFIALEASSSCTASDSGQASATTTIAGGRVVDTDSNGDPTNVRQVPVNPAPNSVMTGTLGHIGDSWKLIFNEQIVSSDGGSVTVNAVHMQLLGPIAVGDMYIGQSRCGPSTSPPSPPAVAPGYFPLTPARILDTRNGTGGFSAKVGPAGQIDVPVTGVGGVPAQAGAVVLNVTVTQPTAASDLTVFRTGDPRPTVSNLNYVAGQTVPNLVIAKVGPDGKASFYNKFGSTHVIADVMGWFPNGPSYNPVTPARILDTRNGTGGFSAKVGPAGQIDVPVIGGEVRAEAGAVVLNVTVTQPSAASDLTVFPTGVTRPTVSNLNYVAGQTVPNLVIAKVGQDGKVSFYNKFGSTHVIADVMGWFPTGSAYNPLTPARILDTRNGTGAFNAKVGQDSTIDVPVTGVGNVPAGAGAVVLNVTVTQPDAASDLTVFPTGVTRPTVSNLNYVAGQTVPNLVIAKVGQDGKVSFYNKNGSTHVIADVMGWFPTGT